MKSPQTPPLRALPPPSSCGSGRTSPSSTANAPTFCCPRTMCATCLPENLPRKSPMLRVCSCWTCPAANGARRYWTSWRSIRLCWPRSTSPPKSQVESPKRPRPLPACARALRWWAEPETTPRRRWAPAWWRMAKPSPPWGPPGWSLPTRTSFPSTRWAGCTPSAAPCLELGM